MPAHSTSRTTTNTTDDGTQSFHSVEEEDSSSSSGQIRKFGPDAEPADEAGDVESGGESTRGSHLLRTVTQYTEYSVAAGQAERETEEEIRRPELAQKREAQQAGFWSKGNREARILFLKQWPMIILILAVYILSVFSIYWGSMYKRNTRFHNLKVLVILEDNRENYLSDALSRALQTPAVRSAAGWEIRDYMPESDVIHRVHTEKYWGALYVTANNASSSLVSAFENNSSLNTSTLVKGYYETSRDMNGVNLYLRPSLQRAAAAFSQEVRTFVYPQIISGLTSSRFSALKSNPILSLSPELTLVDGTFTPGPVLVAPLQVGLIFIIILSFFQIMWFLKLGAEMAKRLKPLSYIFYRQIMVQLNSLMISFVYAVLNRAFQINMTSSWKGGFGIFWMAAYLTMAACTGANENVFLIASSTLPPMVGLWILLFVVLNISGTFSPIELCPGIFKFTHAMPIKNGYELMKVILLDGYRGNMGRYFGVLAAWSVLNSILMPFCLYFFSSRMKKKLQAEAAQRAKEDDAAEAEKKH